MLNEIDEDNGMILCPNCDYINDIEEDYCIRCNKPLPKNKED